MTTMTHFKLQLASVESYHGSGDVDVWLRRVLSFLSMNNQRYNIIAEHDSEDALGAPGTTRRNSTTPIYQSRTPRKVRAIWPAFFSTCHRRPPKVQHAQ